MRAAHVRVMNLVALSSFTARPCEQDLLPPRAKNAPGTCGQCPLLPTPPRPPAGSMQAYSRTARQRTRKQAAKAFFSPMPRAHASARVVAAHLGRAANAENTLRLQALGLLLEPARAFLHDAEDAQVTRPDLGRGPHLLPLTSLKMVYTNKKEPIVYRNFLHYGIFICKF